MEGSMQPQVFQWVAAPAPRAARIDSEIWEGLREDLTRVYRDKTLDETMNWMEVHHEFKASYVSTNIRHPIPISLPFV